VPWCADATGWWRPSELKLSERPAPCARGHQVDALAIACVRSVRASVRREWVLLSRGRPSSLLEPNGYGARQYRPKGGTASAICGSVAYPQPSSFVRRPRNPLVAQRVHGTPNRFESHT
jgi:hypothetical protein